MSDAERVKWEQRYTAGDTPQRDYPTELLERWVTRLATESGTAGAPGTRRRALDLACGVGRNALFLAEAGYAVDAVDISAAALAKGRAAAGARGLDVNWVQVDLDEGPLPHDDYALIVVARFMARKAVPWILDSLAANGYLIYETHFLTEQPVGGPRSRYFRVRPNELLRLFAPLRVVHYAEHIRADREGSRMALAELVACNGDGDL